MLTGFYFVRETTRSSKLDRKYSNVKVLKIILILMKYFEKFDDGRKWLIFPRKIKVLDTCDGSIEKNRNLSTLF